MSASEFTDELLRALRSELLKAADENRRDREIRRELLDVVAKLHVTQDALVKLIAQVLDRLPPRMGA